MAQAAQDVPSEQPRVPVGIVADGVGEHALVESGRGRPERDESAGASNVPPADPSDSSAPTLWAATEENFEAAGELRLEETEAEPIERGHREPEVEVMAEPAREAPPVSAQAESAYGEAEPVRELTPETATPAEEEPPAGPPRRGWWQKLME